MRAHRNDRDVDMGRVEEVSDQRGTSAWTHAQLCRLQHVHAIAQHYGSLSGGAGTSPTYRACKHRLRICLIQPAARIKFYSRSLMLLARYRVRVLCLPLFEALPHWTNAWQPPKYSIQRNYAPHKARQRHTHTQAEQDAQ